MVQSSCFYWKATKTCVRMSESYSCLVWWTPCLREIKKHQRDTSGMSFLQFGFYKVCLVQSSLYITKLVPRHFRRRGPFWSTYCKQIWQTSVTISNSKATSTKAKTSHVDGCAWTTFMLVFKLSILIYLPKAKAFKQKFEEITELQPLEERNAPVD